MGTCMSTKPKGGCGSMRKSGQLMQYKPLY